MPNEASATRDPIRLPGRASRRPRSDAAWAVRVRVTARARRTPTSGRTDETLALLPDRASAAKGDKRSGSPEDCQRWRKGRTEGVAPNLCDRTPHQGGKGQAQDDRENRSVDEIARRR